MGEKKGFRIPPKKSKQEKMDEILKNLTNLSMATRVLQIGIQQLSQSYQKIDNDMARSMGVLNDLQYRTLAMMEYSKMDKDKLDSIAAEMKLEDYNKASDEEDVKNKNEVVNEVRDIDDIVIITSECTTNPEKAIFRSKFKIAETANPEAIEKMPGLKVADKVDLTIDGQVHSVEILGVRRPPKEEKAEDGAAEEKTETDGQPVPTPTK